MPRLCSPECRDRALRLLNTTMEASGVSEFQAITSVSSRLGIVSPRSPTPPRRGSLS